VKRRTLIGAIELLITVSACSYPRQRWQALKQDFQREVARTEERRKSPEDKCEQKGGVFNNDVCYTSDPSGATFTQADCRLRGGLYIDEQCLFAPISK
jgi:hypothetical protein